MKFRNAAFTIFLFVMTVISISSCKKPNDISSLSTVSDAVNAGMQMNAAMEDAANVVGRSVLSGSTAVTDTVVGGSVDLSQIVAGIIIINYDGTTVVDSRFVRSGSMKIQLQNFPSVHWQDQNAVLNITFDTLTYTNSTSHTSYIYNGTHVLTNLSGGLSYQMLSGQSNATALGAIRYRHTASGVAVALPDGTAATWNFNRIRTYTYTSAIPTIGVSSDLTQGGYTNVEIWGNNRQGNPFYNAIVSSTTFNNITCSTADFRDPMNGESRHYVQNYNIELTYGFGASGSVSNTCPYGYQTDYLNARNDGQFSIIQYWD